MKKHGGLTFPAYRDEDIAMSEHDEQLQEHILPPDAPDDPLTGHNYDGIQEYDNPTPAWWTWVFLASVVFAFCYMFLNLIAAGDLSPPAQHERAYLANLSKKFGEIGELDPDAATIVTYMQEDQWLALGRGVYMSNCTSCHGTNAAGSASAPNLTDEHYIYVKNVEDIADVIINGRGNGKMPAWNRLHPNEVVLVSSYIASLRGTNVTGKGPEGEVPPPWPTLDELETPAEAETPAQ